MKETIILQGITIEDLLNELATKMRTEATTTAPVLDILSEAVPNLTKKQAARMLGCSNNFIDDLVRAGNLQEAAGTTEKYQMRQVLQCLLDGRTGRNQPFSLTKIIQQ